MDEKTKELIAIGASIGAHCQPCLQFHVSRARVLGIADGDIQEAIAMGHMVEQGAMSAMKTFARELIGEPAEPAAGGCCGSATPRGGRCCG